MKSKRHPWLAGFFSFGATMCGLTVVLLTFPGTPLDWIWRLNPAAHHAFQSSPTWSILLMLVVGLLCGFTAVGLAKGTFWGVRLAILILSINIVGDTVNAVRGDDRALIGIPIGLTMILYLGWSKRKSLD